jgi:cysteine desulfurase/selenocysteine lyase
MNAPAITTPFDVDAIRSQFPALQQQVHGKPLVYLDNAATSQKPQCVIDAIDHYYSLDNSNVHRGVHALSERATQGYEGAREITAQFLNANSSKEIVFVRGTTEAINLIAQGYGRPRLKAGDEIIIGHIEHHSNIVPWQMLCEQTGAELKVIPVNDDAELQLDEYQKLLSDKTKIVSVGHVSNALGTINPIKQIAEMAHAVGAVVISDGAQATPHTKVDVQDLGVDFYAFSGHKVYGPTGIGALWAKAELLEAMSPYQGGGEMIKVVSLDGSTYNSIPHKFEAGTPNIAGAVGLGEALKWVQNIGLDNVAAWENELLAYGTERLSEFDGVRIIGTAARKASILSFVFDDAHAADVGSLIDRFGIAIRAGHHCAMPAMERFGVGATARASLAVYNTKADIDAFIEALEKTRNMLV